MNKFKGYYPTCNPVYIEWIDSVGSPGWRNKYESTEMVCTSVGNLLKKTKTSLVICLNISKYQIGECMEIPLVSIRKIRKLK